MLSLETEFLWLAFREKYPVGFATFRIHTPGVGYISRVGVLPSARSMGLHKRFIRVQETKAKKIGLKILLTDTTGLQVANTYAKKGYELFTPTEPWAFKNSFYLRKNLV